MCFLMHVDVCLSSASTAGGRRAKRRQASGRASGSRAGGSAAPALRPGAPWSPRAMQCTHKYVLRFVNLVLVLCPVVATRAAARQQHKTLCRRQFTPLFRAAGTPFALSASPRTYSVSMYEHVCCLGRPLVPSVPPERPPPCAVTRHLYPLQACLLPHSIAPCIAPPLSKSIVFLFPGVPVQLDPTGGGAHLPCAASNPLHCQPTASPQD